MNKRLARSMVTVVLLVCAGLSAAYGQYDEDKPSKLNMRIGVYSPGGSLADKGGSVWTMLGVDLTLRTDELDRPISMLSVEWSSKDAAGFEARIMPVTYTRLWWKSKTKQASPYFGLAGGLFVVDERQDEIFMVQLGEDEKATQLGLTGILGYAFNENYFVELRYMKTAKVGFNAEFSGFAAFLGVKNMF